MTYHQKNTSIYLNLKNVNISSLTKKLIIFSKLAIDFQQVSYHVVSAISFNGLISKLYSCSVTSTLYQYRCLVILLNQILIMNAVHCHYHQANLSYTFFGSSLLTSKHLKFNCIS